MKNLLIAIIIIFLALFIGFFIQYIKAWIIKFKIWREKRRASEEDLWMYEQTKNN